MGTGGTTSWKEDCWLQVGLQVETQGEWERSHRHTARLVAKGYSQVGGLDYNETFAPVAKFPTIRALLSMAATQEMELQQMDVKTAFLNGSVDEEIYMDQPEGFVKPGEAHLVCKLQKSLYGLKQAPRAWNKVMDQFLKDLNFKQSTADNCLYSLEQGENILYLLIYVDDLILATKHMDLLETIKQELWKRFKMTDMGDLTLFSGPADCQGSI